MISGPVTRVRWRWPRPGPARQDPEALRGRLQAPRSCDVRATATKRPSVRPRRPRPEKLSLWRSRRSVKKKGVWKRNLPPVPPVGCPGHTEDVACCSSVEHSERSESWHSARKSPEESGLAAVLRRTLQLRRMLAPQAPFLRLLRSGLQWQMTYPREVRSLS